MSSNASQFIKLSEKLTGLGGNRFAGPGEKKNETLIRQVHVRRVRDLYRCQKVSEWVFDLLFRILLNSGNWLTSVAHGLKAGFACFHGRREAFAEEQKMRPPIFISDAKASCDLKELENEVVVIVG